MNPNINDISQRLQNAINIHYDVVDMDAVMSVIKLLEGTKITKEQLETTRLAKHINQLRKRTQNDLLARRAKSLLKRWREMLGINDSAVGSGSGLMMDPHISIVDSSSQMGCSQSSASKAVVAEAVKPKKNIDAHPGAKASRSAVSMEASKPPTTFCNLITGMCGSNNQPLESKSSHRSRHGRDDGDAISTVSNLNSDIRYNSAMETAPIVIDIPDSSSGSNLMISPAPTVAEPIATLSSSSEIFGTQFKHKKNKKDKKRKEERNKAASTTSQFFKQHADLVSDSKRSVPAAADETSFNNPNISEILTLSNSSMSSIFPNEDALKSFNQNIADRSVVPPRSISTNELSFAGKFTKSYSHSSGAASTLNDLSSSGFAPLRSDSFAGDSRKKIRKPPAQVVSANNSNVNSNDSVLSVPVVLQVPHNDPIPTNQNQPVSQQLNALDEGYSRLQNTSQIDNSSQKPVSIEAFDNHDTNPEKKVPKKRGRKKGSKGVDSVIAKETSLSSQMLMTSLGGGGKKVKTTKELYAEMQNRKLGVTPAATSSPTLFSRPPSSCSEPSGHSPRTSDGFSSTMLRNETASVHDENKSNGIGDDDSDTATSEPSGDSVSVHKTKTWHAPASSSLKNAAESPESASIHCQLVELVKDFPPPPDLRDIEMEFLKDAYPCSCQIKETLPQSVEEGSEEPSVAIPEDSQKANTLENSENSHRDSTNPIKMEEVSNSLGRNKVPASPPAKPKKSIFDLDFDQDDDPLLTFLTETKVSVKEEPQEISPENIDVKSEVVGKSVEAAEDTASRVLVKEEENNPWPDWPIYTIEEDTDCVAKDRFNVQTQKVTNFHIKSLHNFYIPNINGNWDDKYQADNATADKNSKDPAKPLMENVCVVPSYDSYIRKDLRYIDLMTSDASQRSAKQERGVYDDSPFLGVSRYGDACGESHDGGPGNAMESSEKVDCSNVKTEVSESVSTREEADAPKCDEEPPKVTKVKIECISPDDEATASGMAECRVAGDIEVSRSMDEIAQSPLIANDSNGDSNRRMKRRKRKRKKYLKELKGSDSGKMKRSKRTMDSDGEQNELSYGFDAEESTMDNESTFSGDEPVEGAPNGLDDDAPDDANQFGDYHEVVARDVSVPFSGSNRIVLTIKKTNKTQSSAGSIPSAAAPKQQTSPPHQAPSVCPAALPVCHEAQESAAAATSGGELFANHITPLGGPEGDVKIEEQQAGSTIATTPLGQAASEESLLGAPGAVPKQKKAKCKRPSRSLRDELFFDNEIEALLNGDDSDSSGDDFAYDYDGAIPPSEKEQMDEEGEPSADAVVPKVEPADSPSGGGDELADEPEAESLSWHGDSAGGGDVKECLDDTKLRDSEAVAAVAPAELADGNNGLIVSFNNIDEEDVEVGCGQQEAIESGHRHTHALAEDIAAAGADAAVTDVDVDGVVASAQLDEMLPNKNCDDFNKTVFLNNNNFHLSKYSSKLPSIGYRDECEDVCGQQEVARLASKTELPGDKSAAAAAATREERREYETGQRAVDEDVQDELGNNCSRIQKFKEWHQVLQLRSYNDELLTVLPYVVLE